MNAYIFGILFKAGFPIFGVGRITSNEFFMVWVVLFKIVHILVIERELFPAEGHVEPCSFFVRINQQVTGMANTSNKL